jgi:hypothetical protein
MALTKIKTSGIADNAITNAKMADDAIDSADFADASIDNVHVATGLDAVKLADGTVTNAEFQYINTLSSNAQTQINAKAPTASPTFTGNFTSVGIDDNADATAITIDSSERVGIGITSSITDPLHVKTTAVETRISLESSTGKWAIGAEDGDKFGILNYGTSTPFIIDSSGNVGIGTGTIANESDHRKLVISGASGTGAGIIEFADTSNNIDGAIFADGGNLFIVADRDGATADSSIRFRVDGSSEKMRIVSSGYVGIGTAAPSHPLTVSGNCRIDDGSLIISKPDSGTHNWRFLPNSTAVGDFDIQVTTSTNTSYTTQASDYTTKLMINKSGNVGIGTDAPATQMSANTVLEIKGSSIASLALQGAGSSRWELTSDNGDDFKVSRNGSTAITVDGSNSNVGINQTVPTAKLNVKNTTDAGTALKVESSTANLASGDILLHLDFENNTPNPDDDGYFIIAEDKHETKFLLRSDGFVGVGATGTPNGTSVYGSAFVPISYDRSRLAIACSNTGDLEVVQFFNPNGQVGSISTNGSATDFTTSSDYRLKENEVLISDGLTRLNQLKPYRFNFKSDADKTVDGFFAHEVSGIVPEAIHGEKDAVDDDGNAKMQGIDQSKLVPLLVSAIQELSAKVEALENA